MVTVPSISVIIPSHNAANFLPDAINSVLAQNYPDLEIILIDDNSSDDTISLASKWGNKLRYFRCNCGSPAAARNIGLHMSSADYVGFLDADDLWTPDHLQAHLAFHALHPELDYSHGYTRKIHLSSAPKERAHFPRDDAAHLNPNPGSMLFRRDSLLRLEGFDESLRFGEDIDLWLRCRTSGLVGAVFAQVVLLYRMHAGNMTNFQNHENHDLIVVLQRSIVRQKRTPHFPPRTARLPYFSDKTRQFPLVSVIITSKDGMPIDDTLRSIVFQDYDELEILVIAEHSSNYKNQLPHQLLRNSKFFDSAGGSRADDINRGLRSASGTFLACLQSGDVWSQDRLRTQVGVLQYNPKAGLVLGDIRVVVNPCITHPTTMDGISIAPWDALGSALIRREAVDLVGELDASFQDVAAAEWLARFSGGLVREKFPLIIRIPRVVHYQLIENCSQFDFQKLSRGNITHILHKAIQHRRGRRT